MNNNLGIKALSGAVICVVVLILINSKRVTHEPLENSGNINNFNEAIASQFNDNIRDVSARLHETEKRLEQIQEENQSLHQQLNEPRDDMDDDLKLEIIALKNQIQAMARHGDKSYPMADQTDKTSINDLDSLLEKPSQESAVPLMESRDKEEQSTSIPFYTIPADSDFSKVTLLSALIGEVPVEGKLMQPLFPFSAMVSQGDLMTANGMQLPNEIIGMKVSGYAIGVGSFLDNISCVRAYVTSALFVFDDGHFITVGEEQMNSSAELINNDSIGYLSTPYGNPCIQGKYITNAPQVLTAMMGAGAIQGAGTALSKWQLSYQSEGTTATANPTGNLGHFAAGGALSKSSEINDWLEKRVQGSFDMVFVPASIKQQSTFIPNQLGLHFSKTITLDKELNGRKLDHGQPAQKYSDTALY